MEKGYLREQFNELEKELPLLTRSSTMKMSGLDIQGKFGSFVEELR